MSHGNKKQLYIPAKPSKPGGQLTAVLAGQAFPSPLPVLSVPTSALDRKRLSFRQGEKGQQAQVAPWLPSPLSLFQYPFIRCLSDHAMQIITHVLLLYPALFAYCLTLFTAHVTTRPLLGVCVLGAHRATALGERTLFVLHLPNH